MATIKVELQVDAATGQATLVGIADSADKVAAAEERAGKGALSFGDAMKIGIGAGIGEKAFEAIYAGLQQVTSAFPGMVSHLVDAASEIVHLSDSTGIAIDDLEAFEVMGKAAGISTEEIAKGMTKLQKNLVEGSEGTRSAVSALGISFEDLKTKGAGDQLDTILGGLAKLPPGMERTALAGELLGAKLGPTLSRLGGGIDELRERNERLGVTMAEGTARNAEALGTAFGFLEQVVDGLKNNVVAFVVNSESAHVFIAGLTELVGELSVTMRGSTGDMRGLVDEGLIYISIAMSKTVEFTGYLVDAWSVMKIVGATLGAGIEALATKVVLLSDVLSGNMSPAEAWRAARQADIDIGKRLAAEVTDEIKANAARHDTIVKVKGAVDGLTGKLAGVAGQTHHVTEATHSEEAAHRAAAAAATKHAEAVDALALKLSGGGTVKAMGDLGEATEKLLASGPPTDVALRNIVAELDKMGVSAMDVPEKYKALRDIALSALHDIAAAHGDLPPLDLPTQARSGADVALPPSVAAMQDVNAAKGKLDEFNEAHRHLVELREKLIGMHWSEEDLKKAGLALDEGTESTVDWSKSLGNLAHTFQVLGIDAKSSLGQVLGGLTAGIAASHQLHSSIADFKNVKATGLSGLMQHGAAAVGAISAGIQAAQSAVAIGKAIFGLFTQSPAEKAAKDAGLYIGEKVSKEAGEAIAATMKSLHIDMRGAELLNLDKLMAGSSKGASGFLPQITDLMAGIAHGSIPAKEGVEQLDKAFVALQGEAAAAGEIGSAALAQVLDSARASGQMTASMKALVSSSNNDIVEGFDKIIGGLPSESLGAAQGNLFGTAWAAAVAEKGVVGAVDAMKGSFEKLAEANVPVPEGIAKLFELLGEDGPARGSFETLDGVQQMFKGVAAQGLLTADVYRDLGATAKGAVDAALAMGVGPKEALSGAMGYLRDAVAASREYGIALDSNTQSLVDQATQQGLSFPPAPMEKMVDLMTTMVKGFGFELPDSLRTTSLSLDGVGASGAAAMAHVSSTAGAAAASTADHWNNTTSTMVGAASGVVGPMVEAWQMIGLSATQQGDEVSIAWNGAIAKMPVFLSDMAGPVEEGFQGLSDAALGPLDDVLHRVEGIYNSLNGIPGAAGAAGGALAGLGLGGGGGLGGNLPDSKTGTERQGAEGLVVSGRESVTLGEALSPGDVELAAPVRAQVRAMSMDIAAALGGRGGGGGSPVVHVHVYVDGREVNKTVQSGLDTGDVRVPAHSIVEERVF